MESSKGNEERSDYVNSTEEDIKRAFVVAKACMGKLCGEIFEGDVARGNRTADVAIAIFEEICRRRREEWGEDEYTLTL